MTGSPEVVAVDAVDCVLEPRPWRFAVERADEIAALWAEALKAKPKMFDGRVLVMHRGAVETGADGRRVFRGAYLETRFSAFLAWRELGHPASGVRNGFGMAALSSADGAFVLGEMASHTANAGKIYFASGTPDPHDVRDGRVDIEGSVRRELREEMGLVEGDVSFDPGFTVVIDAWWVGFMKRVRSAEGAAALKARIESFLAAEAEPELARVHLIRSIADLSPAMPPSVSAYLQATFAEPDGRSR